MSKIPLLKNFRSIPSARSLDFVVDRDEQGTNSSHAPMGNHKRYTISTQVTNKIQKQLRQNNYIEIV